MEKLWYKVLKAWSSDDGSVKLEEGKTVALEKSAKVDSLVELGYLEKTVEPPVSQDVLETIQKSAKEIVDGMMKGFREEMAAVTRSVREATHEHIENSQEEVDEDWATFGRVGKSVMPKAVSVLVGEDRAYKDPYLGFKSIAHFCHDLRAGAVRRTHTKTMEGYVGKLEKLREAYGAVEIAGKAYDGQLEAIGEEGGILIPAEMSNNIYSRAFKMNPLLGRCDRYSVRGNSMTFPRAKDNSRADGSRHNGTTAAWTNEAQSIAVTKLKGLEVMALRLHKLAVLTKMTNEMIDDGGPIIQQWIERNVGDEIGFQVGKAIWEGDGIEQPLGVFNSNQTPLLKVARTTAGTVVADDIYSIMASYWPASMGNAVWYTNNRMEWEHLIKAFAAFTNVAGDENVGGWPLYLPRGGLAGTPTGVLAGRPVEYLEFAQPTGTEGDLTLADMSTYCVITKGGAGDVPAINTAMSIHLLFDMDATAFRATYRIDGQPWWKEAVTPYRGETGETHSPFITLTDAS